MSLNYFKSIFTKLRLDFIDDEGKNHPLFFNIYDSKIARRWFNLVTRNQVSENKKLHFRLTNSTYSNINKIREELVSCVKNINQVYDRPISISDSTGELSTHELNELHEEFENYGDRIEYLQDQQSKALPEKTYWTEGLHNNFLRLNELIHLHEDVVKSKSVSFPNMSVLYDYYPQEIFQPINESDKIWLRYNFAWGGLYLGYNTLGKDWLKINADNDLEVIERDQVRPQERFSAETWINFGPDCDDYYRGIHIERWLNKMDPELRKKVPIDNLNKFCFGRFKIGQLLTSTEYFKKYDSDQRNWEVPNSKTKLDWNLNVFSKFVSIKSIKFIENDYE